MARGRKRKHDPTIPPHIDQARLPKGIYWDKSGSGRWYVRNPDPEGGNPRFQGVAGPSARQSDLEAIMEQRAGKDAKGTIGYVMELFKASAEYAELAAATRNEYDHCEEVLRKLKTKLGVMFDKLYVDRLETPVFQRLNSSIAKGKPESRPGAGDAAPGYPTKANKIQRYLSRMLSWGKREGHCRTNPALGVKQAKERKRFKMPSHKAYAATLRFAKIGGAKKAHTKGSCPPYLWPIMEIAYLCRMRGLEVIRLTDANAIDEGDPALRGIHVSRLKGSLDNVVRWTPRLRAAWDAVLATRAEILARPQNRARPVPIRPEQRFVFVDRTGGPLSKSALNQAWQDFMPAAIEAKVITLEERYTLHGLKHRGITDTKGKKTDKKEASGHKTDAMLYLYDHELPMVDAAVAPEIDL